MSLKIINLTKCFDDKTIFESFSYDFSESGIYLLTGESGVGKTTLLRMIAGLDRSYDGEIIDGGIGRVSFAFQEHRLIPQITALENVVFAISDTKDEAVIKSATNLLNRLGLCDDDIKLTPAELSGGMKQRVSLARAFMKKSPVLLLDEPTKELDATNSAAVRRLIREASENRLVIIATHNAEDVAELGERIIKI